MDLVRKTIKRLHSQQQSSDKKNVGFKLELRNVKELDQKHSEMASEESDRESEDEKEIPPFKV